MTAWQVEFVAVNLDTGETVKNGRWIQVGEREIDWEMIAEMAHDELIGDESESCQHR